MTETGLGPLPVVEDLDVVEQFAEEERDGLMLDQRSVKCSSHLRVAQKVSSDVCRNINRLIGI